MIHFRKILTTTLLAAVCALPATPALASTHHKKAAIPAVTNAVPYTHAISVVVEDADTGRILYTKNADEHRQVASTQKLLTSLIVIQHGNLDQLVTVKRSDTLCEPTKLGFHAGESYTRRDLLTVMLVHSMNDVALCLARTDAGSYTAFAHLMNIKARELGATESHFVNPNGLPVKGQYSTARDMAKIALAAYANPVIRSIVCRKTATFRYADGRVRTFKTTNHVLRGYPLCNGMKTGYTNAAEHCLIVSGEHDGRNIIAVVLGDSKQHIWHDAAALLAWGLFRNDRVALH